MKAIRKSAGSCARAVIPVLVIALQMNGCGGSGLRTVDNTGLPLRTATPRELIARVDSGAAAISGIKGKLDLGLQKNPGGEVKRCRGMLVAGNNGGRLESHGLYLKGYKRLIPTFFTLVSDGFEFWLHIPRDNVVYTGPLEFRWSREENAELYLNAGDLFRALFVQPVDSNAVVDLSVDGTDYTLSIYRDGTLERELWIERKRFTVVRELYYDAGGDVQLEVERSGYVDVGGRLYPANLTLRDAVAGTSVFLDFHSITLDPENIPGKVFHFDVPDDVEVKRVEQTERET
jgi:hypothetical protein